MEDEQLIDQYILGLLDGEEKTKFELRLKEDKAFADQYERIKSLQQGIRLAHLEDKLSMLKDIETNEASKKTPKVPMQPSNSGKIIRWLAAAAAIGAIGWFLWQNNSIAHRSNPELFAEYFVPDENPFDATTRGDEQRSDCYKNYELEQWTASISCILELLETEVQDIDYYYLGISYLGNDMPEEAIESFNKIVTLPKGITPEKLLWYQGLALIYNDNLTEAKLKLEQIKDGILARQAKELLGVIEEISVD